MEDEKDKIRKKIIDLINNIDDLCVLVYFYNYIKGKLKAGR